jgi:hypothetical protein
MYAIGASRHFAAAQQPHRHMSKADINFCAYATKLAFLKRVRTTRPVAPLSSSSCAAQHSATSA